jgi:YD repeat-containing protein
MAAGDRHLTKTQRNLGSACLVWGDVGRICLLTALTRDAEDRVATVTPEGKPTATIVRDANGRVTSVTSTERTVTIDRDVDGLVEGTTVTEP